MGLVWNTYHPPFRLSLTAIAISTRTFLLNVSERSPHSFETHFRSLLELHVEHEPRVICKLIERFVLFRHATFAVLTFMGWSTTYLRKFVKMTTLSPAYLLLPAGFL